MKLNKIFLDLDDVCNKFTMYALWHTGCNVDRDSYKDYNPKWGFDILAAANALRTGRKFTLTKFWNCLNEEAWASFPESDEFRTLLLNCRNLVGEKNVFIVTAPINNAACLSGKLKWILEHLPSSMHDNFVITKKKFLLARPDVLLIDDSDKNIDEFRLHGGLTLLVPRPWNILHSYHGSCGQTPAEHCLNASFTSLFFLTSCSKDFVPFGGR